MSLRHFLPLAVIITLGICLPQASGAQPKRPPASKVEVLQPEAGAELSGTIAVRVKVTPPEGQKPPTTVYFGIGGGPPWVPMQQADQTGEWAAETDSAMVPNGLQNVLPPIYRERGTAPDRSILPTSGRRRIRQQVSFRQPQRLGPSSAVLRIYLSP